MKEEKASAHSFAAPRAEKRVADLEAKPHADQDA